MKYFIAVFVTAVLVFLAATVYYKGLPTFPNYNKGAVSTQSGVPVTGVEIASTEPAATPASGTTVTAGGVLVFSKYTVQIPSDWQSAKESGPDMDKLTLTKGGYKIAIYEAATGGAQCLYPGDPDAEMATRYTTFTEITTQSGGKLRRSGTGATAFTICEKPLGNTAYGLPTTFGHISVTTPASPTPAMMAEIDGILATLKKI